MAAAFQVLKTGKHPHQAYRPSCQCPEGEPKEQKNYAGHVIAPPRCSACGASYHLDIALMSTSQKSE